MLACHRSPVRRSARARPSLLACAEWGLLERAAGPLSRCPSTLVMIPAAINVYSFELRTAISGHVAAGVRGEERESAARAMCMCVG